MFDGPRDLILERLWASPLITQTILRRKGITGREMSCIWPPEESYIDINPIFINDPQFIWTQFSERDSIDSSKPSHKQLQTIIIIKCSGNYITHQQQIVVRNSRVNMLIWIHKMLMLAWNYVSDFSCELMKKFELFAILLWFRFHLTKAPCEIEPK